MGMQRRTFLKLAAGATALGLARTGMAGTAGGGRVVVVGGGIGGSTAARYLRRLDPTLQVTLIEPKRQYTTCPMSNEVLSGERSIDTLQFGYERLSSEGVTVLHERVTAIDPVKRTLSTDVGSHLGYERCIVSPGIDFRWETIEGYDAKVAERIPHAWEAGPQTLLLRRQLEAMADGGTVIVAPPPNPYRCPPGPYERVSQIAWYLKNHKPKSKLLVLDPKDRFAKFDLFLAGWKRYYGYGTPNALIEWVSGAEGGSVEAVDPKRMSVQAAVERYHGDVINLIPAQKAGRIAFTADLVDASGWCPVDPRSFESTRHPGIHVIGDASIASPIPKSAYAANSEAKVCAAAIVAQLNGKPLPAPAWLNTCYSLLTPEDAISIAEIFDYRNGHIELVPNAGGLTPDYLHTTLAMRQREVAYAHSWFNNITRDVFG